MPEFLLLVLRRFLAAGRSRFSGGNVDETRVVDLATGHIIWKDQGSLGVLFRQGSADFVVRWTTRVAITTCYWCRPAVTRPSSPAKYLLPGNAQISRNKVNTRRGWPIIRHCATAHALTGAPLDERLTNPRSRGTRTEYTPDPPMM